MADETTAETNITSHSIRINGDAVPTDKWPFAVYVIGHLFKWGPVWVMLGIMVWFQHQDSQVQAKNTQQLTTAIGLLSAEVSKKNDTISANHDMLSASRDRDEQQLAKLTTIDATLSRAETAMKPIPSLREEELRVSKESNSLSKTLLEIQKAILQELQKSNPKIKDSTLFDRIRGVDGDTKAKNVDSGSDFNFGK